MISEQHSYFSKVREYFETLAHAMETRDVERVHRYLARLSEYTYMFDLEQQDTFDEAVEWMEAHEYWEDDGQPTEHDEWMDYDPDC